MRTGGWVRVDGAAADVAAVRYLVAIERAYMRQLRADAGYAALVTHNPFHRAYETVLGHDEPYSLAELARYIKLPRIARRTSAAIRRTAGTLKASTACGTAYVQIGEYRCGPRDTWDEVVAARALTIAAEVRAAHVAAERPYADAEAPDTAKSVAGWVWALRWRRPVSVPGNELPPPVGRAEQLPVTFCGSPRSKAPPGGLHAAQIGNAVDEIARRLSAYARCIAGSRSSTPWYRLCQVPLGVADVRHDLHRTGLIAA